MSIFCGLIFQGLPGMAAFTSNLNYETIHESDKCWEWPQKNCIHLTGPLKKSFNVIWISFNSDEIRRSH